MIQEELRQLILTMTKAIVDDEREVSVKMTEDDGVYRYKIFVADGKRGQVIGKNGLHIDSIRTIARVAGVKLGCRAFVDVYEPAPEVRHRPKLGAISRRVEGHRHG